VGPPRACFAGEPRVALSAPRRPSIISRVTLTWLQAAL
jgi:hypothetical protein